VDANAPLLASWPYARGKPLVCLKTLQGIVRADKRKSSLTVISPNLDTTSLQLNSVVLATPLELQ
jgi:hypothetical protein